MNSDSVRDDLAFLRSVVETGEGPMRVFGQAYFAAGLCYGGQFVLTGAQELGLLPNGEAWSLVVGLGPTVVFLIALWAIIRRAADHKPGGMAARAMTAMFASAGLANLALMVVIGSVAWRESSLKIWLIYPCVVMVLQGMAWLAAAMLRRRGWMGLVAAGWFATGIIMALTIDHTPYFLLAAGTGFAAFMVAPGAYMMKKARPAG